MENDDFARLLGNLGEEIKAMRLDAGLSQEALALAAEVDRSYVSQLERGVANPSLMILHRISEVLERELQIAFLK
jgi:transcriptional regulator with XRE-family HTH domain